MVIFGYEDRPLRSARHIRPFLQNIICVLFVALVVGTPVGEAADEGARKPSVLASTPCLAALVAEATRGLSLRPDEFQRDLKPNCCDPWMAVTPCRFTR